MADFTVHLLLQTASVAVRDVRCNGTPKSKSPERTSSATRLVIPYQGAFVRHDGKQHAVGEMGQVLLFNQGDGYCVSHPIGGGHASLDLVVEEQLLSELVPKSLLTADAKNLRFAERRMRIDPRAQALAALLRHSLHLGTADTLEAESLALTLAQRALGPRTARAPTSTEGRQHLVDQVKLVVSSDLSKRWTLAEIGKIVGWSPVYLTQAFQQVEGVPLYRYQLRLRLARALDLISRYDDLSALSMDLGFSSHSHFSASFQQTYGKTPSEFRAHILSR
jgi:AraC family transcriptional regulator